MRPLIVDVTLLCCSFQLRSSKLVFKKKTSELLREAKPDAPKHERGASRGARRTSAAELGFVRAACEPEASKWCAERRRSGARTTKRRGSDEAKCEERPASGVQEFVRFLLENEL
jgi:hypothetical protein